MLIISFMTTMTMNNKKTCPMCKYQWISRKEKPKECPRCKRRFDYIRNDNVLKGPIAINKKEVYNEN